MADRHSILVVDDEADVVKSVKDLLRLDYTVYTATRAEEARAVLQESTIHVVMTDQRMPDVTGVEFLAEVRQRHPDAMRLLFTGYADLSAVIDAINKGHVYRYIHKPWEPDELPLIVKEACDRYELLAHRRELTRQLQVKNAELERANRELTEANRLRESFIHVASHELRTPLAILTGLTQLAIRMPSGNGAREEFLRRIDRAAGRLDGIVGQMVSMLSAGQFDRPPAMELADLGALCRCAAEDVAPFVQLRHQALELDLPGELGLVRLEPARIRNCVDHLLLNAIKFTPDGGRIHLSARRTQAQATIEVADSGVGIAEADLPRVFAPFFTEFDVENHSSGQFEFNKRGIGLGLSIVKAFVEMHGGCVLASSTQGRGSTFTIRLPIAPAAANAASGGSPGQRG
ncbi:MAG: hybrid sensor histidine kinase/response regulator [Tepidisphaeraceae bacterium]|jgi:signal transduction histidine kinase